MFIPVSTFTHFQDGAHFKKKKEILGRNEEIHLKICLPIIYFDFVIVRLV